MTPGLDAIPTVSAAVAAYLAAFRVVRWQYSPSMARQPDSSGRPSRPVLLALSGAILVALVLCPLLVTDIPFGIPMAGGVFLVVALRLYLHSSENPHVKVRDIAGYVRREILLTLAPWLALTVAIWPLAVVLSPSEVAIVGMLCLAANAWMLIYQLMPRVLASKQPRLVWRSPSRGELARDGLVGFGAVWLLVAADGANLGDNGSRLKIFLPPLLAACAALGVWLYEKDRKLGV